MGTAEPFRMCFQQEIKYAEHSIDRGSDTHEGKQCSMVCTRIYGKLVIRHTHFIKR